MVAPFLHSLRYALTAVVMAGLSPPLDPSTQVVHRGNSPIHTLLLELSDGPVKETHAACLVPFFRGVKHSTFAVFVKTDDHFAMPCCFARTGITVHSASEDCEF